MDLAEQIARRAVAAHAVLLRVGPAHAAPHVAVHIATHSVGYAGCKPLGENLAVGQLASIDIAVEHPNVRGASVGQARINDVQPLLIRGETDAVRLRKVIDNRLDLAGLAIDAEDIVLVLLWGLLQALVVAADAVGRIGEPDRAIGGHHNIVRRIEPLAVVLVRNDGDGSVELGAGDASGAVFAGHEPPLRIDRVAVGIVRRLTEDAQMIVVP